MVTPAGFEGFWRESALLGEDASPLAHEALGQRYRVKSVRGSLGVNHIGD
jgi:hypothetical protein